MAYGQFGPRRHRKRRSQRGPGRIVSPFAGRPVQQIPTSGTQGKAPYAAPYAPPQASTAAPPRTEGSPGDPGWEGDTGWQEYQSWALNQRNQTNTQYENELAGLRTSTGLFDAQGNPIDQQQVEQLNPFSQAAMLRKAWRQAQTGTLNSYASAGQLYSGALANAAGVSGADPREQLYQDQRGGYNSFAYQQNLGGLKSSFNEGVQGLDRWRLGVFGDIDERGLDAGQEARDRWTESRPPPPRSPVEAAPPPGAPGFVKGQPFEPTQIPRYPTKGQEGDVQQVRRDPLKPASPAPQGFRWSKVNGKWRLVRRAPSR